MMLKCGQSKDDVISDMLIMFSRKPNSLQPNSTHSGCAKGNKFVINALLFSKDRAMQLDATLRSLRLHYMDAHLLATTVLYAVSNDTHARHYAQLAREHPGVHF